jgi:bifunctional ADP-heptose synthase (sugar kinase/adenylyltransferase)
MCNECEPHSKLLLATAMAFVVVRLLSFRFIEVIMLKDCKNKVNLQSCSVCTDARSDATQREAGRLAPFQDGCHRIVNFDGALQALHLALERSHRLLIGLNSTTSLGSIPAQ